MNSFNRQIQNQIVKLPEKGIDGFSKQIKQYLSPETRPLVERAFGAIPGDKASLEAARAQMAKLRLLAEAADMVSQMPSKSPYEQQGVIKRMARYIVAPLVGATAGSIHGPVGSVAGSLLAQGAAEIPEALTKRGQLRAEQFGAPIVRPQGVIDPRAYQLFRNVPAMDPTDQESGYQQPQPLAPLPRQGRKKGGRVTAMNGQQLIAALEKAKREVNNQTKVLLNSSDETVAQALEIANRNIEG
jgi:hypothetical protein